MSTSETITKTDLKNILNDVLPTDANIVRTDGSGNVRINGNFYASGNNGPIGLHERKNTTTSVSSGTTYTSISASEQSLNAGRWLIIANCKFPANSTGQRGVAVMQGGTMIDRSAVSAQAVGSSSITTRLTTACFVDLSSTTTMSIGLYQSSGSSLSCAWNIDYIRIR